MGLFLFLVLEQALMVTDLNIKIVLAVFEIHFDTTERNYNVGYGCSLTFHDNTRHGAGLENIFIHYNIHFSVSTIDQIYQTKN